MTYMDKPPLEELYHYGIKRRSGRYPYGSGDNPFQHAGSFLSRIDELKKSGLSESKIAEALGIGEIDKKGIFHPSTTRLRAQMTLAKNEERSLKVDTAKSLREDGLSFAQIGEKMGINESSVRSLLNKDSEIRMNKAQGTSEFLKAKVKEKGMLDVGAGVEKELNTSKEQLNVALEMLRMEGYEVYGGRVPQATNPGKLTTLKVLCPPGTEHKAIFEGKIESVGDYITRDGGETYEKKFNYPASMDSKRLKIRYKEDGGIDKDGVVELRPGVQDLSLGEKTYSQVRILVDGNKYIKGMAVYGEEKDFPPGVDVIFNTNKSKSVSKLDVLKDIKDDPDNPFGSSIKDADQGGQYWYTDKKTGEKKLGLINKRADEGDWNSWSNKLPSQFLSKQPLSLAKKQLSLAIEDKQLEFDEIKSLTNPTVKKRLLQSFSDDCDSAAVHLKAAALPRQKYQVLIPLPALKDNEVYAPNYKNGEKVALIRYPHGGTFEIPILTVNNKQPTAKKLFGNMTDGICINSKVAERLSGADFDGDTAMVIPTNSKVKIKSSKPLDGLVGFDPKMEYGTIAKKTGKVDSKGKEIVEYYNAKGVPIKVMRNTQNEMGRISNLITDMTLRGADEKELARAVRHSMVVIDAEKHKLDYKSSYEANGIDALKKKYQEGGASTLISRAKSQQSVPKTQGSPKINIKGKEWYDPSKPEGSLIYKKADDLYYPDRMTDKKTGMVTIRTTDGKKVTYDPKDSKARAKYEPVERVDSKTGEVTYTNKDGSIRYSTKMRTVRSTKMAETDDAYTLLSKDKTPMEKAYADYANKMKSMANEARKELAMAGRIEYSSAAKATYKKEYDSLMEKLLIAEKNAPRERQAQTITKLEVEAKKKANPDMTNEEVKKISDQSLKRARELVGAKRTPIEITDKEWEAIQAGAISENKLTKILNNADIDVIREKATPRTKAKLSTAKVNSIKAMFERGYTTSEIAQKFGISTSTVMNYVKGKE